MGFKYILGQRVGINPSSYISSERFGHPSKVVDIGRVVDRRVVKVPHKIPFLHRDANVYDVEFGGQANVAHITLQEKYLVPV